VTLGERRCPTLAQASYPRPVAATRRRRTPSPGSPSAAPAHDPDGGSGTTHELLIAAVEEATRLLDADGSLVYLMDHATGRLRYAHDAGIRGRRARALIHGIELEPGTGMFGRAVAERAVVLTRDYPADPSFQHATDPDKVVADIGIRSMVVAPLVDGADVFGALGAFSTRPDAFDAAQIALVRSLADHAAAAMANTRLIEELDRSRIELAERAEAERALREINARISAASDLTDVLQRAVDEAARLLRADGARIDLIDARSGLLRWAYASGAIKPSDDEWPDDPDETLDQGISGQAVASGRPFWTGDYLHDDRFPHGSGADAYIQNSGITSVMAAPLIGGSGAFGALTVFTSRHDAWDAASAALIEAIAAQAAIAINRTRLIEELDRSRTALARRAEAEQALREIAARITAMRDPTEILQQVVELASRLVDGDGAILDLLDPSTGNLHWAFDDGLSDSFSDDEKGQLWISVGVGATGIAVAEDRVIVAGGGLADLFPPSPESTAFYERTGFQSMIAAPVTGDDGPLGVVEVYSREPDAFESADADLIQALAGQAAIAITNARLIRELEQSREENARRAETERTLREIAARVSAILDPGDVLERIVTEAARLLGSDGARIDLWDEDMGALRWAHSAGDAMREIPDWGRSGGLRPRQAVAGLAFAERASVMTADYLTDQRFETTPEIEAFVRRAGIRAVISTPLTGERGPVGVLSVVSRQPGAYGDADVEVLAALAAHASIALTNADLMTRLDRSRSDIQRRAEAEQALRVITARITVLREPHDVLQLVVDESLRLLRADGAMIDQYDPDTETLQWAYDSGLTEEQRDSVKLSNLRLGEGVAGTAVAEGRVVTVGDYLGGQFVHNDLADSLAKGAGLRDLIVAPIIGEGGPLGAIEVFSRQPNAFDVLDSAVLGALAEQAAIAITNARLIDELERSQAALAKRAETERTLRDITARIAALHDPEEVLARVVEDARRLLGTDGAHLTRMADSGTYLVPVVAAGERDDVTRRWLLAMEFPLGGGINGLAAQLGTPIWTRDYVQDPRIPHGPDDDAVAERLGLRGMAATPLRAPGGDVIGTLAVSTREPHGFSEEELDLLQGLADQAAIALTNSNLLERVSREEARFRDLVQTTPDVIWRADTDGRLTFIADSAREMFGRSPDELIGEQFLTLVDPAAWPALDAAYRQEWRREVSRMALALVRADGSTFTAEVTTIGVFEDDRWVGAQGTVRDVSERVRLETELRRSEERYRYLVQNAPDLVWSIDGEARLTFLSDACERLTGFRPDELLGQHFGAIIHSSSRDVAEIDWTQAMDAPSQELRGRINLQHRDGSAVPAEFIAVASLDAEGRFSGANGSVRDMRERDRLEAELRRSEERYRFLVDNSPDIVFAIDPDGRFSFVSESIRRALGRDPAELVGMPYTTLIWYDEGEEQGRLFGQMREDPDLELLNRMLLIHSDDRLIPFEVSAVGVRVDGEFGGVHGSGRDIGERERLERDLRTSEERYRTLASSSPDLVFATDAEGRYTFLSDRAATMLGWDLEQAIGQHYSTFIAPGWESVALASYEAIVADPTHVHSARIDFVDGAGRPVPLEINVIGAVTDGVLSAIHGVARDISERERLQQQLQRSEERYRFLVENSPDVVFATDVEGRFTFLSTAIEQMTGHGVAELTGQHFSVIVDEATLPLAAERWQGLMDDPTQEAQATLVLKARDGRLVSVDVRSRAITVDGTFAGIQGATRDISEQVRLATALRRQAGELAAGEERAHLARELHDSVTQALFSMTLVSRSVEMLIERDPATARAQLAQLRDLQREALAEMRALIFELRPGNLEQDGLVRALKTHSGALQGRLGLPIVVESDLAERLPLALEEVLYRIAQEALHNIVKHAAAQQVRLGIHGEGDHVVLRITDDGKGFDPATVPEGHLGLAGMRARADRIGASFDVTSRVARGTTVTVTVPAAVIDQMRLDDSRDDVGVAVPASIRDG
jgi:PAS domain S-box-containing protein